jgi:hypothetical protein
MRVERLGEPVGHRRQTTLGRDQRRRNVDLRVDDQIGMEVVGQLSQRLQLGRRDHPAGHGRREVPELTLWRARRRRILHGCHGTFHRGGSSHSGGEPLAAHARLEIGAGGDDDVVAGGEQRLAQRYERPEHAFHRGRTAQDLHVRFSVQAGRLVQDGACPLRQAAPFRAPASTVRWKYGVVPIDGSPFGRSRSCDDRPQQIAESERCEGSRP